MNKKISEEQEFIFAEHFERDDMYNLSEEERHLQNSYIRLRELIHSIPVPQANEEKLLHAMRSEMTVGKSDSFLLSKQEAYQFLTRKWAFRYGFAFLILILFGVSALYFLPNNINIQQVQFGEQISAKQPFWWWRWKLQHGFAVQTPYKIPVSITLKDRSTIVCKPHTQLTFNTGNSRSFNLHRGEVHIEAAPNPELPMSIETSHGNVEVIGTEFTIRILE